MVQRITLAPQGPEFSRFVMGYWRLMDWNMSPLQLASFIEEHLDLGITTVDHADIYGGYACEAAFGEASSWFRRCVSGWKLSPNAVLPRRQNLNIPLVITLPIAHISSKAPSSRW